MDEFSWPRQRSEERHSRQREQQVQRHGGRRTESSLKCPVRVTLLVRGWLFELLGGSGALMGIGLGEAELGMGLWALPLIQTEQDPLQSGGYPELRFHQSGAQGLKEFGHIPSH